MLSNKPHILVLAEIRVNSLIPFNFNFNFISNTTYISDFREKVGLTIFLKGGLSCTRKELFKPSDFNISGLK